MRESCAAFYPRASRMRSRRGSHPTARRRRSSSPASAMPRRSCGRSSTRSSAARLRYRYRRQEALDDLPVGLIVEVLLDDLAGAGDGEINCLTAHIGDGALLLLLDLAASALQHLLLLLVGLLHHLRAQLLTDLTALDDDLLRLVSRRFDLLLLLGERTGRGFAIPLRSLDRFLEGFLSGFDRCSDFREDQLGEDDEKKHER